MQARVGRCEEGRMMEKLNKHQEGRMRPSSFGSEPLGRLSYQWNCSLGSKCFRFECANARIAA